MKRVDYSDPLYYYGSDAAAIRYLQHQGYSQLIHPELPYTAAEIIWAVGHEMAMTLEDVLARRTRALFLDAKATLEAAPYVAELMRKELNHDQQWKESQLSEFEKLAKNYLLD